VHPPSTPGRRRHRSAGSSQGNRRHTEGFAYRCYLPVLTGFTSLDCAGPGLQHRPGPTPARRTGGLGREFGSAI